MKRVGLVIILLALTFQLTKPVFVLASPPVYNAAQVSQPTQTKPLSTLDPGRKERLKNSIWLVTGIFTAFIFTFTATGLIIIRTKIKKDKTEKK